MSFIIGLTGSIASGKTIVLSIIEQYLLPKFACEIIDMDVIGHTILSVDTVVKEKVINYFGENILVNGYIDRKKLGKIVFKDHVALDFLNSCIHPIMINQITQRIKTGQINSDNKIFIISGALLFELYLNILCNTIVYIKSSKETRLSRLIQRSGLSIQEALDRINCQQDDIQKENNSDFIVANNCTMNELNIKILLVLSSIEKYIKKNINN